jgi:hypothetical protein
LRSTKIEISNRGQAGFAVYQIAAVNAFGRESKRPRWLADCIRKEAPAQCPAPDKSQPVAVESITICLALLQRI